MDIDRDGTVKVSNVNIGHEIIEELQNKLLLFYTGISRDALSILGEQSAKAKEEQSDVAKSLLRIKEIGLEIKKSY